MSEKQYTVYQVADLLGSTPGEVLTWVREGRLACRGDAAQRRIPQAALVRFLKSEGIDIEQVLAKAVLGAAAHASSNGDDAPRPAAAVRVLAAEAPRPAPEPLADADDAKDGFAGAGGLGGGRYVGDVLPRPVAAAVPPAEAPPRETDGAAQAAPVEDALDAEIVSPDPADRLADAILSDAVARRATTIHLEPAESGLVLRLRVDGVLQEKANFRLRLPPVIAQGLVAHFLRRAGLASPGTTGVSPVASPRMPDMDRRDACPTMPSGSFAGPPGAGNVRFRLNVCPTRGGRRLVVFVADADADRPALADLGLEAGDLKTLRGLLHERSGLILVTARPGGGASTTLRAMAGELAGPHRGIFWIGPEDRPPVDGASLIRAASDDAVGRSGILAQHSRDAGAGGRAGMPDLQTAEAVHAAAAQDSDVIVISEIWDSQTLLAAAEAALGGALVLGRLHERTAPAALDLVRKAGLAPWRLATALLAVVAQTTARKLCPACRREGEPADAVLDRMGLCGDDPAHAAQASRTFVPVGCKQCYSTGYAGRTGVFSILEIRDETAGLLREGASAAALAEAAAKAGMKTLPQAAMELARRGDTSLEESAGIL